MNLEDSSRKIISLIGGTENVNSLTHCATRLRFNVKNEQKVDLKQLGSVEGVLTAQNKGGQIQVVIGDRVEKFYDEINQLYPEISGQGYVEAAEDEKGTKKNILNSFVETIASLFTPILPALVACGMIQALLAIAVKFGLSNETPTYQVLSMMGQLVFYFLPILLAVTSAEKFKTNKFIALLLAGSLLYFTIKFSDQSLSFLGIPFKTVTYNSTVIPIILIVYVMKYVYNFFNRIIPDMLKVVLVPMLTLLVMVPLGLSVLGPIGAYIGTYIAKFTSWLFNVSAVIAGGLLGFFRPILVMFGMHYSLMPIQIQQVADSGSTMMLASALLANVSQAGAALGVTLRTKDEQMKTAALSASITAVCGVTEPAIYGVNLRYKKPFFIGCAVAGVAAAIAGAFGVYANSIALPGIFAIPTYSSNIGVGIVVILFVATFVASCICTMLFAGVEKQDLK